MPEEVREAAMDYFDASRRLAEARTAATTANKEFKALEKVLSDIMVAEGLEKVEIGGDAVERSRGLKEIKK